MQRNSPIMSSKEFINSEPVFIGLDVELIKQYAYLFLVTIDGFAIHDTYADYENREKGYSKALLNAYHFAFKEKLNHEINVSFIKSIYQQSTAHLSQCSPSHKLAPERILTVSRPNTTFQGLSQFVKDWLIDEKEPIHAIHLNSPCKQILLTPINMYGETGLWLQISNFGKITSLDKYQSDDMVFIYEVLNSFNYKCFIQSIPDIMSIRGSSDPIEKIIDKRIKNICDNYNALIKKATTPEEKLQIIAKHVQLVCQLLPFEKRNVRTCYILLNRLLHEEKLPLSILLNPARLYGFSTAQLVKIIEQGQRFFLELTKNNIPHFRDQYMPYEPTIKPENIINAENELMNFIQIIRKNIHSFNKSARHKTCEANQGPNPAKLFVPPKEEIATTTSHVSMKQEI